MNALILGSNRGIGAATATLLRHRGWNVLTPTRKEWDALYRRPTLKTPPLDALVYCVGTWHSAETVSYQDFLLQYRLSVISLYEALCQFLPVGCVVAVSSTRGLIGGVATAAYSCGKAAQIALMQGFAREYAGTRFNVVCPSLTDTDMAEQVRATGGCKPDARAQKPAAVATAIVRLIESDANGKVVKVTDGKESEVAWKS